MLYFHVAHFVVFTTGCPTGVGRTSAAPSTRNSATRGTALTVTANLRCKSESRCSICVHPKQEAHVCCQAFCRSVGREIVRPQQHVQWPPNGQMRHLVGRQIRLLHNSTCSGHQMCWCAILLAVRFGCYLREHTVLEQLQLNCTRGALVEEAWSITLGPRDAMPHVDLGAVANSLH
jgi:hypothetical protein